MHAPNTPTSTLSIQIFDSRNREFATMSEPIGVADNYNWIKVNGLSSYLQAGQYRFRFIGRRDLLHYDDMRACFAQTANL